MEHQQKMTKFLAKRYLERNPCPVPDVRKGCYDPCLHFLWGQLEKEKNRPLFPPLSPKKLVTWDEAMASRPPLRIDMDGPGPDTYLPLTKTGATSFTIGRKSPPKEGGGRTSWQKTWFQSSNPFTKKTHFESQVPVNLSMSSSPVPVPAIPCPSLPHPQKDNKVVLVKGRDHVSPEMGTKIFSKWPSPFDYPQMSTLGPDQPSLRGYPCFSLGRTWDPVPDNQVPAPNEYENAVAFEKVQHASPAFSIHGRVHGTCLWPKPETTPGPAYYNVEEGFLAVKPRARGFSIHGERRNKRHDLGPFACL
ncbi:protein STPG3 [Ambystoma mexicanum]|uniref:protein STPG3 n=1 Tax=Ambystoma mexicanum TaxID=8296 RepID=UPI0037E93882